MCDAKWGKRALQTQQSMSVARSEAKHHETFGIFMHNWANVSIFGWLYFFHVRIIP